MSKMGFRFMSWNLKDFGIFDYSSTMEIIAETVIGNRIDILMVMEVVVNRQGKKPRIAGISPTAAAETTLSDLDVLLNKKDAKSKWTYDFSNNNCANKSRDAYALFFRSAPHGPPPTGAVLPKKISINGPFDIYRYLLNKKDPGFGGGRRPAGCNFTFTSSAATPTQEKAILMVFHALAEFSSVAAIKRTVTQCVSVAQAAATNQTTPAVVIGGDFNVDYKTEATWYNSLAYTVGIKTNGASSLFASPNFNAQSVVLAGNAYDNFLFSPKIQCQSAKVISVIEAIKQNDETLKNAYIRYYPTHKIQEGKKASGVSDHLPIMGEFIFN